MSILPENPLPTQQAAGKTRAEYVAEAECSREMAKRLRMDEYETHEGFQHGRTALLADAQICATLALSAPDPLLYAVTTPTERELADALAQQAAHTGDLITELRQLHYHCAYLLSGDAVDSALHKKISQRLSSALSTIYRVEGSGR